MLLIGRLAIEVPVCLPQVQASQEGIVEVEVASNTSFNCARDPRLHQRMGIRRQVALPSLTRHLQTELTRPHTRRANIEIAPRLDYAAQTPGLTELEAGSINIVNEHRPPLR